MIVIPIGESLVSICAHHQRNVRLFEKRLREWRLQVGRSFAGSLFLLDKNNSYDIHKEKTHFCKRKEEKKIKL